MRLTDDLGRWKRRARGLTRNDPAKQGYAGGSIDHCITGVEVYDNRPFTLPSSPIEPASSGRERRRPRPRHARQHEDLAHVWHAAVDPDQRDRRVGA